jgi:hypothetical protein
VEQPSKRADQESDEDKAYYMENHGEVLPSPSSVETRGTLIRPDRPTRQSVHGAG